ncbi:MAG: ABC transporter permease [Armatimonadetes bacterium]|nr:ABC transporter permease [Armatimonadota bacterium]
MLAYVASRLIQTALTLVGISILVFLAVHLTPGDPAVIIGGNEASDEEIRIIRQRLGLDQPLPVQYLRWVSHVLRGDLGRSHRAGREVYDELATTFPVSLALAAGGLALAVLVGIPLGIVAAVHRDSLVDLAVMGLSVAGMSVPVFWLALLMILLFALRLEWLPSSGWGTWQHFLLPAVSVSLATLALLARMTRAMMVEVLLEDYVRTARAKGLPERLVRYRHALRTVLPPVVTVIGLRFGLLVGGAVITETVFAVPGLGRLVVLAVQYRDFPTIQAGVLLIAVCISFINLGMDVLYGVVDPRVRYV